MKTSDIRHPTSDQKSLLMRDPNKIRAFQFADELVIKIYSATKSFPKEELYGLTSQLRRAAISVPSNIVEGARRQSKKDYLHFLFIAYASLGEAGYLLQLALKLGYFDGAIYSDLNKKREETSKTLNGLIRSVKSES